MTDPALDPEALLEQTLDLEALIQQKINETLGKQGGAGSTPAPLPAAGTMTFEQVLDNLDPTDSEAALAMLDWLVKNKRLGRVGVLDGGQGYLFVYSEPKGSTKAGYTPGATQGGRIVDEVLDKQREAGTKPVVKGLCVGCFSIVRETDEGIRLDDNENVSDPFACTSGQPHRLAAADNKEA